MPTSFSVLRMPRAQTRLSAAAVLAPLRAAGAPSVASSAAEPQPVGTRAPTSHSTLSSWAQQRIRAASGLADVPGTSPRREVRCRIAIAPPDHEFQVASATSNLACDAASPGADIAPAASADIAPAASADIAPAASADIAPAASADIAPALRSLPSAVGRKKRPARGRNLLTRNEGAAALLLGRGER